MDQLDLFRRLARARDDDPAWRDLLELCLSQVRRTLWFRNWMPRENSRAFVADIAQEVLLRLVAEDRRRLDRLVALGSIALQLYLRRMVENAVCDQLRADMVRIKLEDARWRSTTFRRISTRRSTRRSRRTPRRTRTRT